MKMMYSIFPYEKIVRGKKIFVYGAGKLGISLVKQVEKNGYCELVGFVDRNAKNITYKDYLIIGPEEISDYEYDYIIVSINKKDEVVSCLKKCGVNLDVIVFLDENNFLEEESFKENYIKIDSWYDELPDYMELKKEINKTTRIDVLLKKETILSKYNKNKVIQVNSHIKELLFESFCMREKIFYVIDEESTYLNTIDLMYYDVNELDQISADIPIKDFVKICKSSNKSEYLLCSNSVGDAIKIFSNAECCELPILTEDKKMIGILKKEEFYRSIADIVYLEKEPIIDKDKKLYIRKFPGLGKYAYNKYSQNGEDGILEEIFNRIASCIIQSVESK